MATPPKAPTGTTPPRRKATARKPTRASTATPKAVKKVEQAEGTDAAPATAAPKPAPKRSRAATATAPKPRTAAKPRAATKPRGVAKTAAPRIAAAKQAAAGPVKLVADTREKMGDRNFFAALIGGVAAVGAAITGILFAAKAAKPTDAPLNPGATAHQADGEDSSASFEAGIADEGTIPGRN